MNKNKTNNSVKFSVTNIIKSILSLVIVLFLIMSFVVSAYRIPTGSMEKSLRIGDMLLVNKFVYGIRTPDWLGIPFTDIGFDVPHYKSPFLKDIKSGDVVVFKHFADDSNQWVHYVKRCVGLPGQTIEVKNKVLYVDGKEFDKEFYKSLDKDENYIQGHASSRFLYPNIYEDNFSKKELGTDERLVYFAHSELTKALEHDVFCVISKNELKYFPYAQILAEDKDSFEFKEKKLYINNELFTKMDNMHSANANSSEQKDVYIVDKFSYGGKGMNLTFQTRDAIISHNGEIHESKITPNRDKTEEYCCF